jgi:hypothetical protein
MDDDEIDAVLAELRHRGVVGKRRHALNQGLIPGRAEAAVAIQELMPPEGGEIHVNGLQRGVRSDDRQIQHCTISRCLLFRRAPVTRILCTQCCNAFGPGWEDTWRRSVPFGFHFC